MSTRNVWEFFRLLHIIANRMDRFDFNPASISLDEFDMLIGKFKNFLTAVGFRITVSGFGAIRVNHCGSFKPNSNLVILYEEG
jgi:hypothetical protein